MVLGKLKYSVKLEEGSVEIDWEALPESVVGLDILKDWLIELETAYNLKLKEVYKTAEE